MKKLKCLLLTAVLLSLCAAVNWSQSCQIGAYGYITDTAGNPIANATVHADTSSTTTDADGYYSVSRVQINCNSLYVQVEAAGYETVTKYTPSGAGSYRIDFTLNPVTTPAPTPVSTPTATPRPTAVCNCQLGDVNCDGQVSIVDALMIAQYSVGLRPGGFSLCAADVSNPCIYTPCTYDITIVDALILAQYIVGLITGF